MCALVSKWIYVYTIKNQMTNSLSFIFLLNDFNESMLRYFQQLFVYISSSLVIYPIRPIDYIEKKKHEWKSNTKHAIHSRDPCSLVQKAKIFLALVKFRTRKQKTVLCMDHSQTFSLFFLLLLFL